MVAKIPLGPINFCHFYACLDQSSCTIMPTHFHLIKIFHLSTYVAGQHGQPWSNLVNILTQSTNSTFCVFLHTNLRSSPRILHLLTYTLLKFFIALKNTTYLYHILIFNAYNIYKIIRRRSTQGNHVRSFSLNFS